MSDSARLMLSATVARQYYLEGRSKVDIANDLLLSRFAVARLLDYAREQGIVEIRVKETPDLDLTRSIQMLETFGLRQAVVIGDKNGTDDLLAHVGRAAADLLTKTLTADDVLGLPWARSVGAMVAHLKELSAVPIVQLTGALPAATDPPPFVAAANSVDIVRDVARIAGGPAYRFFAPFLVPDRRTAQTLRRQPDVTRAFAQMPAVTVAVAGIGAWAPGQSTLFDAATPAERQELSDLGVVAELAGVCIAADGRVLHTSLNDRMISVDGDRLRSIDQVIAIPYGLTKAPAVLAALRSGLVTSLVTHRSLAEALLHQGLG